MDRLNSLTDSSSSGAKKRLRRIGRWLIGLGIVSLLLGCAFTFYGMTRTFYALAASPDAPQPSQLAGDLSEWIAMALIASAYGWIAAIVLISLGIAILVRARRSAQDYQS